MSTTFDLKYNLTDYDELVGSKYSDAPALEDYPTEDTVLTASPVVGIELEEYVSPRANTRTYEPVTTFAPKILEEPSVPTQFESYAVPTKQYSTSNDTEYALPGLPESHSNYIIEDVRKSYPTRRHDTEVDVQSNTRIQPDAYTSVDTETNFETRIKLNSVGMVAVVSFIAVTIMILSFIIANGIAISAGSSAISTLQAENAALTQSLSAAQAESSAAYQAATNAARELVADGAAAANGFSPVGPVQTIPPSNWTPAPNPDVSSNFFDRVAQFFNRLFSR
ncbi:MAG: hypothetical protein FWC00_01800 [Firmicutes bacterium]|nr:hypothetical protein [Bacillota bacterium]